MIEGARAHPAYEVAVVGHRGFLGRAITAHLRDADVLVRGFGADEPMVRDRETHPDVESVRTIVWCAGRVNARLALERPDHAAADLADFRSALEALERGRQERRLILLSSGGTVYGPPATPPFHESDPPAPVNSYGELKAEQERALAGWDGEGVALRVANAYGPGQVAAPGQGVLAHWMNAVQRDEPVALFGDLTATRDYVYSDDIAAAVAAVHRAGRSLPPVLNIGSGVGTTLEELVAALREAVAPRAVAIHREPARSTDASHSVLDVSLAKQALGWQPRTTLAEGVLAQWLATSS